jgi:hypothetical protein
MCNPSRLRQQTTRTTVIDVSAAHDDADATAREPGV